MNGTLSNALEIVLRTDAGRVRGHNEDAVFANPHLGFVVLADGMGGYNAGEVASSMATTVLASEIEAALDKRAAHVADGPNAQPYAQVCLREAIADANAAIYGAAQRQPQCAGMGTTLVAALFYDNRVSIAHVGDSRLYRWRDDELVLLTRDHSLLQEQIDSGMLSVEAARFSQNRNLVTRALGVDPQVEADLAEHAVSPGDIYLLCSDGLNDMLQDDEIALGLQALAANPELAARQLVQMANDGGGRDNVSVILVKVLREFPAESGWWAEFKARFA